jgi:hypothetical protein
MGLYLPAGTPHTWATHHRLISTLRTRPARFPPIDPPRTQPDRHVLFGMRPRAKGGDGYLAGEWPYGLTTFEGVPVPATVRVLLRTGMGELFDGLLIAEVQSSNVGQWRVEGLNPNYRYDVVGRKDGCNDVIVANVTPAQTED